MQAELSKVIAALDEFYAREEFLFEKDLGERALTHRFAVYLERQFPELATDCHYDRLGERVLKLPRGSIVASDDHLCRSIYPDIAVHRREIPDNLLAIEIRKATNHTSLDHDQHKLRALTDSRSWFAYGIGVMLVLGKDGVTVSEIYSGGALEPKQTAWFSERLSEAGHRAAPPELALSDIERVPTAPAAMPSEDHAAGAAAIASSSN